MSKFVRFKFKDFSSTFKHLICFQALSRALKFLFQIQAFSRISQARYEPWRNNARFTQARKTTHGLDGQHQDVDRTPRGRVNQNDRDKWRKYVHGVANPRIEDGWRTEQKCTDIQNPFAGYLQTNITSTSFTSCARLTFTFQRTIFQNSKCFQKVCKLCQTTTPILLDAANAVKMWLRAKIF